MARLTYCYRKEDSSYVTIGRRQFPLGAGENSLMMLMDLNSKGLSIDSPQIRGKELEEFTRKYNLLTPEEMRECLEIDSATVISVLNQCVQCVGCRRRVERLFNQLSNSGHPTLDPLVLKSTSTMTITDDKFKSPQALGTILYRHHEVLNNLLDNKLRNKTRCILHSLDAFRCKPFSETWREVWQAMKHNCRDEVTVIETKELHEVLENYLKKHKFCQGCRTKIEKAYKILVGETTTKEKGFVAALYANIKKCHPDKHIHVLTNRIEFLDTLIRRAEPEVNGSYSKLRERHAKTLEVAQEEVLTCVGMIMYERLRRIYVSLREEERACQVLAAVGVHALCRSFDMAVEIKQGISNLELLYQEISRAEKAKEHKREQKKLKKKKKKSEKKNSCRSPENIDISCEDADEELDETLDAADDDDVLEMSLSKQTEVQESEGLLLTEIDAEGSENENLVKDSTLQFQKVQTEKKKKPQKQKQKQKTSAKKNKKKRQQSVIRISCSESVSTPTPSTTLETVKCNDCLAPTANCPCDVRDSGYGSESNSHGNSRTSSVVSSSEGSEVSCSDGFCNHDHEHSSTADGDGALDFDEEHCDNDACESLLCQQRKYKLSLEQMLDDFDACKDGKNLYIPAEVLLDYRDRFELVQQRRLELRQTLRQNFALLCRKKGLSVQ